MDLNLLQGLDSAHKQRVAEVLGDPEAREKQRSRESLISDTVKYESGPDGGEEVSMSVEWNGVSAAHTAQPHTLAHTNPNLSGNPILKKRKFSCFMSYCCIGSTQSIS